jgi:hypothetical protein
MGEGLNRNFYQAKKSLPADPNRPVSFGNLRLVAVLPITIAQLEFWALSREPGFAIGPTLTQFTNIAVCLLFVPGKFYHANAEPLRNSISCRLDSLNQSG